jgi:uncharacterized protein
MPATSHNLIIAAARDALLTIFPNAWALYVYGSFARGDHTASSDVDLAVLLPPDEQINDLLGTLNELSARVGREVDLVDLRRVSDVLRREVLAEGFVLFVAHPGNVLEWEGNAMTRYQQYREEIKATLEEFEQTGIGYGQ